MYYLPPRVIQSENAITTIESQALYDPSKPDGAYMEQYPNKTGTINAYQADE